jgi:hypothetical protein
LLPFLLKHHFRSMIFVLLYAFNPSGWIMLNKELLSWCRSTLVEESTIIIDLNEEWGRAIFTMIAHWNNSPQVNIFLLSDIVSWWLWGDEKVVCERAWSDFVP